QDGAQPTATNTLILTNVPPQTFAKAGNNDGTTGYSAVKKILEEVGGGIKTVVLLKSFRRILVVYDATSSSQRARRYIQSHPFILSSNPPPADYSGVCVYFGDHTPTDSISSDPGARAPHINYLQVPETEKNFLLSPPGSPPIDWVQIREHSPVMGGHGDALWL
ncbi:Calcipressin-domain-containing protein, partial [Phlyctochytrium arcticum]